MSEQAFSFLRVNERTPETRSAGLTEIRGAYDTLVGKRYLEDLFESMGQYIDSLKSVGGPFSLMPNPALVSFVNVCHNSVKTWRTGVPAKIIGALGLEHVMFEAADPEAFTWYVKNYGPEVNLLVDHSQIVQFECLRSGIWGTADVRGLY